MPNEKDNDPKIAVRCEKCKKVLAFKLGTSSGFLQLKCPVCKTEIKVDLSLVGPWMLSGLQNSSLVIKGI